MTVPGSSAPHGTVGAALPAIASGTSIDFTDARALPRALRCRRSLFIMGLPGTGKTRVARGLAGRRAVEWSDQWVEETVAAVHRGAPWPETVRMAPRAILNCPERWDSEPWMQAGIQQMLRLRDAAGGWTAIVQSRKGSSMADLMVAIAPARRASISLRFPTGAERLAFARSLCDKYGLPGERAEAAATIEPGSYTAVINALGLETEAESFFAASQE